MQAPTAAVIHRCAGSCKKLFHASCIRNKLPVANDDVILPENRSFAASTCTVSLEKVASRSSFANPRAHPNEDQSTSIISPDYDNVMRDPLTDYVQIMDDLMQDLFEKISMSFLFKNKETFVKIAMIF